MGQQYRKTVIGATLRRFGLGLMIAGSNLALAQSALTKELVKDQDAPPRVVFTDQTAVYLGDAVVYFPDLKTVHGGDLLHTTAPFIDYGNGGSSRGRN